MDENSQQPGEENETGSAEIEDQDSEATMNAPEGGRPDGLTALTGDAEPEEGDAAGG